MNVNICKYKRLAECQNVNKAWAKWGPYYSKDWMVWHNTWDNILNIYLKTIFTSQTFGLSCLASSMCHDDNDIFMILRCISTTSCNIAGQYGKTWQPVQTQNANLFSRQLDISTWETLPKPCSNIFNIFFIFFSASYNYNETLRVFFSSLHFNLSFALLTHHLTNLTLIYLLFSWIFFLYYLSIFLWKKKNEKNKYFIMITIISQHLICK